MRRFGRSASAGSRDLIRRVRWTTSPASDRPVAAAPRNTRLKLATPADAWLALGPSLDQSARGGLRACHREFCRGSSRLCARSNSCERGRSGTRVSCGTIVWREADRSTAGSIAEATCWPTWRSCCASWRSCCASGTWPVLRPMICPRVTEIVWRRRECTPSVRESEKPTAAVINVVGSIVPASACGRDGIRLRFAFSGSCFDHGGMNRQRGSCRQQKREIAGSTFCPNICPRPPSPMARQTSSWLGTWVSFPQLIHRIAASRRARKATAGHSSKTVNECVLGDTHPYARLAIAEANSRLLCGTCQCP